MIDPLFICCYVITTASILVNVFTGINYLEKECNQYTKLKASVERLEATGKSK